jgi:hypothetical protein
MPITVTLDCNQQIVNIYGESEETGVTAEDILKCDNSFEYYKRTLPYGEMCFEHVGCNVKKQCATCTYDTFAIQPSMNLMTQRRIHSIGIRQPSHMRTSRIASLNTHDCINVCEPQNNLSDRATPSVSIARVKRNGSSTRRTQTANRPGAMTPGGIGVDQKHGSYERYLNAKKGRLLRSANSTTTAPMWSASIQMPTYM